MPNIYGSDLAIQISGTGDYVVQDQDVKNIKNSLEANETDYKSIGLVDRRIMIRFEDSKSQLSSKTLLKNTLSRNYVVALNLAPSIPQWLSNIGGKAMSLGLDLRGGVHFLLEVDMEAVVSMAIDRYYNELRAALREDRLYKSIAKRATFWWLALRLKTLKLKLKSSSKISCLI